MKVLLWSLALTGTAFLIHLAVWKIRLPRRQTKTLLLLFFATRAALSLGWGTHPGAAVLGWTVPDTWVDWIRVSLFFLAFTLAYMITYSALEADSPSLVMIQAVADAGPQGLPRSAVEAVLTDDLLVKPRVRDMLLDQMAQMEGDRYRLTPKGRLFARIFIVYRRILGAARGG